MSWLGLQGYTTQSPKHVQLPVTYTLMYCKYMEETDCTLHMPYTHVIDTLILSDSLYINHY